MDLKAYLDAVSAADKAVHDKRAEIDELFKAGKKAEAMALKPALDQCKADLDAANQLYVSMRDSAANGSNPSSKAPAGANVIEVDEDDLTIGMSTKDIQNYSILRLVNAVSESQKGNPRALDRAGLEIEASAAMAKKLGRNPQGVFVPWDIQIAPMAMRGGALRARNDQSMGDPEYGGYLKQTQLLTGSFIDVLRNKMVTRQAGVTVMTGLVGDIDIPKKTTGSTYYWIGEGSSPSKSDMKFGQVEARPRTIGAYLQLTRRFLKQSSMDAEMMAREDLAACIALGIDEANLHGKGVKNQPLGVQYMTGIGSVIGGTDGAVPDWADIIDLETEVSTDNADTGSLAYITNTKMRGVFKKASKVSGQNGFVWEDGEMNGYPAYATNQVKSNLVKGSSGAVCSAIFFGNWADLVDCFWAGLDLLIDPYTNSTSGDVLITALQDVDVVGRRAVSFSAMLDAKSS
ncbi:MAG: phage-like protein [Chloroflexi bacterium]|nr:MAG: phage-like protein [Chloroflexota bacterium]